MKKENIKEYVELAYQKQNKGKMSDKDFAAFIRELFNDCPAENNAQLTLYLADKVWSHPIAWKILNH